MIIFVLNDWGLKLLNFPFCVNTWKHISTLCVNDWTCSKPPGNQLNDVNRKMFQCSADYHHTYDDDHLEPIRGLGM